MNGIQSIAATDAERAHQADVLPPDWEAALPRLRALQRLGVKTLPTARVIRWNYIIGGVLAAAALVWKAAGASYWLSALAGAIAVAEFVHGHERAGAIRTGDLKAGTIERLLDYRLTDPAVTASDIIIATLKSDPAGLIKTLAGSLEPIAARLGRRYVLFSDRFLRRYPLPLCPGERPLVLAGCMLRQVDHPKFMASGVLAMTDRRLIFIVRRRSQSQMLFAEPIAQFQVCDWYAGKRLLQRFQWILSVRRPTGERLDLQFLRVPWSQQARAVFESLASISEREAPPALEAYWRRLGVGSTRPSSGKPGRQTHLPSRESSSGDHGIAGPPVPSFDHAAPTRSMPNSVGPVAGMAIIFLIIVVSALAALAIMNLVEGDSTIPRTPDTPTPFTTSTPTAMENLALADIADAARRLDSAPPCASPTSSPDSASAAPGRPRSTSTPCSRARTATSPEP